MTPYNLERYYSLLQSSFVLDILSAVVKYYWLPNHNKVVSEGDVGRYYYIAGSARVKESHKIYNFRFYAILPLEDLKAIRKKKDTKYISQF